MNSLNFSIDLFESCIEALNKVRLVRTLSKEAGQYIFCLMSPLCFKEFIADYDDVIIEDYWFSGDVRPGREEEKWLNLILRKISS